MVQKQLCQQCEVKTGAYPLRKNLVSNFLFLLPELNKTGEFNSIKNQPRFSRYATENKRRGTLADKQLQNQQVVDHKQPQETTGMANT